MEEIAGLGWVVTSYEAVRAGVTDRRLSASTAQALFDRYGFDAPHMKAAFADWFLYLDSPEHTRLRRLVQSAFSPRAINAWEAAVRQTATRLVEALPTGSDSDLLPALCSPLATAGIGRLLGTPPESDAALAGWSHAVLQGLGAPSPASLAAAEDALEQIDALTSATVAKGGTSGVLHDLAALEDERLTPMELAHMASLLLVGGQETSRDLMANTFVAALADRAVWASVVADADVADGVVGEVLRLEPSVAYAARLATTDLVFAGAEVRAGDVIYFDLRAANRDPDVFDDPDALDPKRSLPTLSFGHGMHHCIGAHLARLEARVALATLAAHHPSAVLTVAADDIAFRPNFIYRGRVQVPVRL